MMHIFPGIAENECMGEISRVSGEEPDSRCQNYCKLSRQYYADIIKFVRTI